MSLSLLSVAHRGFDSASAECSKTGVIYVWRIAHSKTLLRLSSSLHCAESSTTRKETPTRHRYLQRLEVVHTNWETWSLEKRTWSRSTLWRAIWKAVQNPKSSLHVCCRVGGINRMPKHCAAVNCDLRFVLVYSWTPSLRFLVQLRTSKYLFCFLIWCNSIHPSLLTYTVGVYPSIDFVLFSSDPVGRILVQVSSRTRSSPVGGDATLECRYDQTTPGQPVVTWYKVGADEPQLIFTYDTTAEPDTKVSSSLKSFAPVKRRTELINVQWWKSLNQIRVGFEPTTFESDRNQRRSTSVESLNPTCLVAIETFTVTSHAAIWKILRAFFGSKK